MTNESRSQIAGWKRGSDLLVLDNVQESTANVDFQNAYMSLMLVGI